MEFQRTIHTIGQGAFYSEKIGYFRMVYDCGSLTLDASALKKRVFSDLEGDTEIGLLFISHFDADHVNGVRYLDPRTVILPFLSKDQMTILKIYNEVFGKYYDIDLAENPESVFPNAEIIRVMPDGFEHLNNPIDESPVYQEETLSLYDMENDTYTPKSILSNTKIQIGLGWEFIPFNPNWDKYSSTFMRKVGKELDWDQLTRASNGQYVKKYKSVLQEIYDSFRPKNQHSLIVYSNSIGPAEMSLYSFCNRWTFNSWISLEKFPAGCIYWGDITIKNDFVTKFFNRLTEDRMRRIGMIQIPHHGSYLSNREGILSNKKWMRKPVVCALSTGEVSRYGHPSVGVMQRLTSNGGLVEVVTESISTLLSFHGYVE